MKSILVPVGGSDSDGSVLATALAAARLFSAHLRFVHIRLGAGEAAVHTPHVAFASGPALAGALAKLDAQSDQRSIGAVQHVQEFCSRSGIDIVDIPSGSPGVTASLQEEKNDAARRLIGHARHSDLVILARAKRPNGLPPNLAETLLMGCGRPLLLASETPARSLAGTIMVCWRETADAARAVAAATPFLAKAERVVFVAIAERENATTDAVNDIATQFKWHGIASEAQTVAANGRAVADVLSHTAESLGADLMVMGAFGHSRARELIFGGCTQAVLRHCDRPVLMFY
jgi:nucleotide-binding universal stress UspA family protein